MHQALWLSGSGPNNLDFEGWGDDQIENLVGNFLALRFPTVLAANKADDPASLRNIANLREALSSCGWRAPWGTPPRRLWCPSRPAWNAG